MLPVLLNSQQASVAFPKTFIKSHLFNIAQVLESTALKSYWPVKQVDLDEAQSCRCTIFKMRSDPTESAPEQCVANLPAGNNPQPTDDQHNYYNHPRSFDNRNEFLPTEPVNEWSHLTEYQRDDHADNEGDDNTERRIPDIRYGVELLKARQCGNLTITAKKMTRLPPAYYAHIPNSTESQVCGEY